MVFHGILGIYLLWNSGALLWSNFIYCCKQKKVSGKWKNYPSDFYHMDDAKFRQIAYEIARFHHEKYNGRGYPDGLAGEQIPLHARIMAIADVFDAVSQKRCYRDAMTLEDSFSIIEKGTGTDFDPHLAQIFLDHKDEVVKLMKQFEE